MPGVVFQYRGFPDGSGQFPWVSDSCIDLLGIAPGRMMADASSALRRIDTEASNWKCSSCSEALTVLSVSLWPGRVQRAFDHASPLLEAAAHEQTVSSW